MMVANFYFELINLLDDRTPKVRNCCAWVLYKFAEHAPTIIFTDEKTLDTFFKKAIAHLDDHQRIVILLFSAIKGIYEFADKTGYSSFLNNHAQEIL